MDLTNLLTKQYAVCIYIYGTRTLASVSPSFYKPVMKYAFDNFTKEQIYEARLKGFITDKEYVSTVTQK